MRRNLRIAIPLVLAASVVAAAWVSSASAVHQTVTGGTPFRVPLVPRYKECTSPTPGQLHGGGLPIKTGCSNPVTESTVAKLGTNTTTGRRVGNGRIDVCNNNTAAGCTQLAAAAVPDVRIRGNSSDIKCNQAANIGNPNDPCPAGTGSDTSGGVNSDYDPRAGGGPYTSNLDAPADSNAQYPATGAGGQPCDAGHGFTGTQCGGFAPSGAGGVADMVATATIAKAGAAIQGNAIRVTDHWNSLASTGDPANCGTTTSCTATVVDQPFPVPVVCKDNTDPNLGSYCGLNTTANTLVPNVVEGGRAGVVEIGQIEIHDVGADGVHASSDDKTFGIQGIFIP